MINGKNVLAIIPARGGSKGIPKKNIRCVGGKPLIAWTIEESQKTKYIDRVILSSEDEEIIRIARSLNCEVPFKRPAELATDETPGIEPILHAIDVLSDKYYYIVMLQPTSPLRLAEDIDGCVEICSASAVPACVSVTESVKSPYLMYTLDALGHLAPVTFMEYCTERRQDLPKTYVLNGAVYVAETSWLRENRTFLSSETKTFDMPQERSLDIDAELDMKICELLLSDRDNNAR